MGNIQRRPLIISPETFLHLAKRKDGICAAENRVLRQLVGFKGLGAEPYLDTIKVAVLDQALLKKMQYGLEKEDYEEMDLFTLFIRRPPYEPEVFPPIILNQSAIILGSYIWFVKPVNGSLGNWDKNDILMLKEKQLLQDLAASISRALTDTGAGVNVNMKAISYFFDLTGIIGYGEIKSQGVNRPRVELKALLIPSLLEHVVPSSTLPEVRAELSVGLAGQQTNVHIVYGIDTKLLKDKEFKSVESNLRKSYIRYQKNLSNGKYWKSKNWLDDMISILIQHAARRGIRYDVGNFNYVSYCASSHYMSTFPLAPKAFCPFCRCVSGKSNFCTPMFNGKRFHWRRQAFPKVYPRFIFEADVYKGMSKGITLPFSVVDLDSAKIHLIVNGVDMFVPGIGKVGIDFNVEFQELLHSTNGVFILIPDSITGLLVNALITSAKQGCSIMDSTGTTDLLKLLLTKFVIRKIGLYDLAAALEIDTEQGVNLSISSLGLDRVLNLQVKDINDVYKNIINPGSSNARRTYREFSHFIEEILAHTIAHVLYILVREDPEIPEENVAYIYGVVRQAGQGSGQIRRIAYAGIYERSKYGVLQLDKEIADALKKQASRYCQSIKTLTEAVQYMLAKYFEDAERTYMLMQGQNSLKNIAINALNSYPQIVAGYKKWLSVGLAKDIVNKLQKLIETIYREFKKAGFELDFPSFNFIIMQKKEDIKSYLVNYVKNKLGNTVSNEDIEDAVEVILRETLQNVILAKGPDYCLDGCYVNIHLEKTCTKAIEENLYVSWELLRLFLYLTGLLRSKPGQRLRPMIMCGAKPNIVRVTGAAILGMLRQASLRVKIGSAYVNAEAISFIKELLERGVSVSIVVDSRSCKPSSPDDPCKMLRQLKQQYGDRFDYDIAGRDTSSTHEKEYIIDNLRVYTSWNFLVGAPSTQQSFKGPVAQSYVAEYVARGEE